MNKDDFDLLHQLRKDLAENVALNLIKGLFERQNGSSKKNCKSKEKLETYAEEEFIRKTDFNELRCEMPGVPRSTFLMVFSPDGTKVASTHGNHNIYITDLKSGKNIRTLAGHPRTPWCIAFHPTSDQIVASGCLGGQVRIWDLSGGSEVWTAVNQTVIASLAFHPNDRVLAIATYNGVYFWDWSQPEPFIHAATYNVKEKVRYVAFDTLGQKLITGIANSPMTRWERVRAPVPVPRQERCASPYRRRITQRLVNSEADTPHQSPADAPSESTGSSRQRALLLGVPERQRRITVCYQTLVREYERLVQRYLQLYRPPLMIDRGTDPMEPISSLHRPSEAAAGPGAASPVAGPGAASPVAGPSGRSSATGSGGDGRDPVPGTSEDAQAGGDVTESDTSPKAGSSQSPSKSAHNLLTPSRIFSVIKKPSTLIRGTQTSDSKKNKARDGGEPKEKRLKKNDDGDAPDGGQSDCAAPGGGSAAIDGRGGRSSSDPNTETPGPSGLGLRSAPENLAENPAGRTAEGSQSGQSDVDELLSNIRRTAEEEVRSRILPIIRSVPANDRPELIRLFENSREHVRKRFRKMYPSPRKFNRLPVDTTSESSSSDDERSAGERSARRNPEPSSPPRIGWPASPNVCASGSSPVRNFNTELEQLVTSLLTEIEGNETDGTAESDSNANTQTITDAQGDSPPARQSQSAILQLRRISPPYAPAAASRIRQPSPSSGSPSPTSRQAAPATSSNNLFQEIIQLFQNRESSTDAPVLSNTSTRTTNSTVYTTSSGANMQPPSRRRFFSHRISAFIPTRVGGPRPNFINLTPPVLYVGIGPFTEPPSNPSTFGGDELTNYSELENSEDDPPPPPPPPPDENHPADPEPDISSMYSNIVQELESSLENVVRLRVSTRPGETSNMLNSFSERLESILSQSSVILRNITNSMEMLNAGTRRFPRINSIAWNHTDASFFVRDQRSSADVAAAVLDPPPADPEVFGVSVYSAVAAANAARVARSLDPVVSDHTYPRNPPDASDLATSLTHGSAGPGPPPLVATIHLAIMHIQRQARMLRQQVEVIEQIDRAMLEVEQLQLIRHLIVQLIQHLSTATDESAAPRSTNRVAMSSMRQMMAGTRISDSSPYDSPPEESLSPPAVAGPSQAAPDEATPSSSAVPPAEGQAGGSGTQNARPRSGSRKTYPPSRMLRLAKQSRKYPILHFSSRRNSNRAEHRRTGSQSRTANRNSPAVPDPPNNRFPQFNSMYSGLDSNRLGIMSRRLELLLTEQMRSFASAQQPRSGANRSTAMLGEHILALRLHGCVLRMNRVLGYPISDSRADPTAAVSRDGVSRYNSRHFISLVVDSVSRHVEELAASAESPQTTRAQTHGVLVMSLLLTELLQLIVVDTIPPPGGADFNPERGALARRIEHMCNQMLHTRPNAYSQQLTRCLRQMRTTMRNANASTNMGEPFHTVRRNVPIPRPSPPDRMLLLGSMNRQAAPAPLVQNDAPSQEAAVGNVAQVAPPFPPSASPINSHAFYDGWYSTISDLISQNAMSMRNENVRNRPSTSSGSGRPSVVHNEVSSNNDNSDDDDNSGYPSSANSNLYRASNINLAPSNGESSSSASTSRPWNLPSVQINDVPVTEPTSSFAQRLMSQRQRFADRVSELRSVPHVGLFRPRFLHPFYASVNPFDADLDDPQREQIYDSDMITTVTPNHRIQAWDVSDWTIPNIGSPTRNVVVSECKIHNDASVDIAKDGTILVTLLPSGGYLNVTNRLGVYSLRWETLGQCLYTTSFEQNAVSVSLSPLGRHLVVGLASRIVPNDRWIMARVFKIEQKDEPGDRLPVVRELEQSRDSRINCIRWLPSSGQGLIYATNTGNLVVLT